MRVGTGDARDVQKVLGIIPIIVCVEWCLGKISSLWEILARVGRDLSQRSLSWGHLVFKSK